MTKKKIVISLLSIAIIVSVSALLFKSLNEKLPPKNERHILGNPEESRRGNSQGNFGALMFGGDDRYYFEYKGYVYYHQPQSMDMNGNVSGDDDFKINNSDPATFQIIDSNFAKDKNQVYYWGTVVDKADPETFKPLDWPRAKDKNYIFSQNEIIEKIQK